MAPGNADVIRPIYEEWGRGNWRPRFEVYHSNMQWGWSDEFPGLDGVYQDRRDPNPRLHAWLSGWEHWRAQAEDYLELGDQQGAHVFELRDGKVVRMEIFANREMAVESVRSARSEESDRVG